ncbi:hypothetical protein E2C01_054314 [Portunus trituberculatus]|uniref:Uncharacterized protein n=1 Tax=Portunus trituberculatus TaxID=210409 RepID=A0A5B7GSE8_PORTR|nr:hypothetical protein [Portunus trituberculatus]
MYVLCSIYIEYIKLSVTIHYMQNFKAGMVTLFVQSGDTVMEYFALLKTALLRFTLNINTSVPECLAWEPVGDDSVTLPSESFAIFFLKL